MANQTISGLSSLASPSSAGLLWLYDPNASPADRGFRIAKIFGPDTAVALSSTPYTLATTVLGRTFLVTTGASNFVFNLVAAASWIGYSPITIVKVDSGAGAVQVVPNGTDAVGNAGNVSVYLGAQWQSVTLVVSATGQWVIVSGVFVPHQAVDTDGTQLFLGKLRHLPLGNTTSRSYSVATPIQGAWSSAVQATGVGGVPTGAKAIRAKVFLELASLAAGVAAYDGAFSDNNANTPASGATCHPEIFGKFQAAGASNQFGVCGGELDLPLNSSGQFYLYSITISNTSAGAVSIFVIPVGYYMGD